MIIRGDYVVWVSAFSQSTADFLQLIVIFITARSSTKQNVVVLIKKITSSDFIHTRKHAQTHPTDPDGCLRCSWRSSSGQQHLQTLVYSSNHRAKINAFMPLRCKCQSYESQFSCCSLVVSTVELQFRRTELIAQD